MTTSHDLDTPTLSVTRGRFGPEATFEGRTFTFGGTDFETPESLRAAALRHQEAAKRSARSARFALALAERMEQERAEEAARAAAQRRERAAATRARRADPFGFKALLEG